MIKCIDLINISLEPSTHSGLDMAFSWLRQVVESALKVAVTNKKVKVTKHFGDL